MTEVHCSTCRYAIMGDQANIFSKHCRRCFAATTMEDLYPLWKEGRRNSRACTNCGYEMVASRTPEIKDREVIVWFCFGCGRNIRTVDGVEG